MTSPADGAVGTETKNKLNSVDVLPSGVTASPTPSPTPTPAPTYTIPESTVRSGSSGDDAKLVQSRLKELGYYTGKVDGKFGSGSVKALEAFQETNGLEADGHCGQRYLQRAVQRDGPQGGHHAHAYAQPHPQAHPNPGAYAHAHAFDGGQRGADQAGGYGRGRVVPANAPDPVGLL